MGRRLRRFHIAMMALWSLLVVPTALWWKDSILWVALMSIYACVQSHFTSYMAARAEHAANTSPPPPSSITHY